ncbi:MAG TPA: hypothetical protein VEY68_05555 [Anoxybacillus sp.]|jgi:Mg2+ and Co2+ transporter CorA|nr:hypothetical protein [Anoxybacillus sp.]
MMGDHSIQDVHTLAKESTSQIKLSLERISEALTELEKAIEKKKDLSDYDLIEGKRDIKKLRHSISEIRRMVKRKKKLFAVIKKWNKR